MKCLSNECPNESVEGSNYCEDCRPAEKPEIFKMIKEHFINESTLDDNNLSEESLDESDEDSPEMP